MNLVEKLTGVRVAGERKRICGRMIRNGTVLFFSPCVLREAHSWLHTVQTITLFKILSEKHKRNQR